MTNLLELNEGDRVKGLYRGVAYSGTVRDFAADTKRRTFCAYVTIDSDVSGTEIMPRKAGEVLKITHGVGHSTIEVVA